jgi:hypothetical protein
VVCCYVTGVTRLAFGNPWNKGFDALKLKEYMKGTRRLSGGWESKMKMIDDCRYHLVQAGLAMPDADQLRRIAMTLHRWHELECGDGNAHGSWCIARGKKVNEYDDNGKPFIEYHSNSGNTARYSLVADRERGAQKRLAKNMPGLFAAYETKVAADQALHLAFEAMRLAVA